MIIHSKPWITLQDHESVSHALSQLGSNDRFLVEAFETRLSEWVYGSAGVAVASGTSALVLSLLALKVGVGDEVLIPTYVCRQILTAVLTVGATPIFCDIDSNWTMRLESAIQALTSRTKAVILPHMYGCFADVKAFRDLGIPIIEDCAQAVDYEGERKLAGDLGVFSFHFSKCFTTGEGGMVVSTDDEMATTLRSIRDGRQSNVPAVFFSALSGVSAALGLSQLSHYNTALNKRRRIANLYYSLFNELGIMIVNTIKTSESMFLRFPIEIEGGFQKYGLKYKKHNVQVQRGVEMLLHRGANISDEKFPVACHKFERTVTLPIHPELTDEEVRECAVVTRGLCDSLLVPAFIESALQDEYSSIETENLLKANLRTSALLGTDQRNLLLGVRKSL